MAETIKLTVEARDEFGKGAARRVRRQNKVPAVLYGRGTDPIHITLPGHEAMLALRQANALLSLAMPDGAEQLALPKQVQRHPVKNSIEHVDLLIVHRGERVTVQVPLVLVGAAQQDALVNQERTELSISAEATSIPGHIEVSLAGLTVGTQILAGEVALPDGVELDDDPDALVVSINQSSSVDEMLEAGDAEGAEDADDEATEESDDE